MCQSGRTTETADDTGLELPCFSLTPALFIAKEGLLGLCDALPPTPDFGVILQEIRSNPTWIFWG